MEVALLSHRVGRCKRNWSMGIETIILFVTLTLWSAGFLLVGRLHRRAELIVPQGSTGVSIIIPTGQFAGEFDARFGDSLVYGGGVAVRYTFGPRFRLGVGVAGYYYLEQARVFPFLVINLKLSDRIRITNPFRLGPAGPAGIILSYQLNPKWDIGVGGAYRSYRFRLDYNGPIPNGIGQYNSFPLFVRLGYTFTPNCTLGLYGGLSIYNHLRVEDRDGDELYDSGQNVSPLIGASISGRF